METSCKNFGNLLVELIPHPLVFSSIPSKKKYWVKTELKLD
jgi:hypothetical protein